MLRLESISRNYGAREVLKDLSWSVPPRARVGLVGRNGSGKTTLLRLISGEEEPDAGTVDRPRGASIGYLPQEGARVVEGTVLAALLSSFPEVARLESEIELLHEAMTTAQGRELDDLTHRAGDLQHRFEVAGGFRLESEARRILTGLGFETSDHLRPLAEMSGGYRMRAALGALLLRKPDYLLLDEPTNHLDLDAVAWLEGFLDDSESALVIVSHDRAFLNRLATSIADLDRGKVTVWAGNYDRYRVEKEAARDRDRATAAQEGHRVAEVERFIERFRYKSTKARQVQSRIKMLDKMKRTEVAPEEKTWRFLLPPAPRSSARVLHLRSVMKSFDDRLVLDRITLDLFRGDRVALVGPNGCGKSTLLKMIAGQMAADSGDMDMGEKVVMHYFAQHVLETLRSGRTVLEEMQAWSPGRTPGELRSLLGVFQYSGDDVFKTVDVLSGGEKNRLALARLMLDPGNFILLDEPTNHLDLPAREALEDALARYDGTLLFVSHDRYFINKVATKVAGLAGGRIRIHDGGYDAYRSWLLAGGADVEPPADERADAEPDAARSSSARSVGTEAAGPAAPARAEAKKSKEEKRVEAQLRAERNKKLRGLRDQVKTMETAIAAAERRLDEINARLADAGTYQTEGLAKSLGEQVKSTQVYLSRLNREWEEALTQLEKAEAVDLNR
ncbi:MAG TPA: ATP-binding cassette domain-containing protein [Patescibacteria group bacterium]|nr:ATP-binding cassette domain-containing protein [Patescibacteria group bacterium]